MSFSLFDCLLLLLQFSGIARIGPKEGGGGGGVLISNLSISQGPPQSQGGVLELP